MTDIARPKILVVDDVTANLVAMRHLLYSVRADIFEAHSGNEALALCLEHTFALILLDVQMPDMDGFEVASHLSNDPTTCDIPVVFVTATYLDDINRLKGYTFGAVDYISKPINDAILLSKVTVFLDLHVSKLKLKAALSELAERNRQLEDEIDERRRVEKQVRHMATHDALTGLGNRILFLDRLDRALAQAAMRHAQFALLYLDIDGFKGVNDSYGHGVGDRLLCAIADRLRNGVRREDIAARLSGDEFAVIMDGIVDAEVALSQANRLCAALEQPYVLADQEATVTVEVSASIGVALYPDHSMTGIDLMRSADRAMYQVKQAGKRGVAMAQTTLLELPPSAAGPRSR